MTMQIFNEIISQNTCGVLWEYIANSAKYISYIFLGMCVCVCVWRKCIDDVY